MPWGDEETPATRWVRRAWWLIVAVLWLAMAAVAVFGEEVLGPAGPPPAPAPPPAPPCQEKAPSEAMPEPEPKPAAQTSSAARWETWVASWYGEESGEVTASGERFDADDMTAAHRTLPFGTRLLVTYPGTGRSVVVRVNDRGPYVAGRDLDLSRGAAEALGMIEAGVAPVMVRVLREEDQR